MAELDVHKIDDSETLQAGDADIEAAAKLGHELIHLYETAQRSSHASEETFPRRNKEQMRRELEQLSGAFVTPMFPIEPVSSPYGFWKTPSTSRSGLCRRRDA
jgi:hypothetical protein